MTIFIESPKDAVRFSRALTKAAIKFRFQPPDIGTYAKEFLLHNGRTFKTLQVTKTRFVVSDNDSPLARQAAATVGVSFTSIGG